MMREVPFIDLSRSTAKVKNRVLKDWQSCLEDTTFIGGPAIREFEEKARRYLGVNHFLGCSNGTDAILLALQALGVKPQDRVAVPNLTFWAPVEAILQLGAEVVLIDIDTHDTQMCFEEFQKAHDEFRFSAAIFVHLFGWTSSAISEFRDFCQNRDIALLEDGAQCFGVNCNDESIYRGSTISTISFFPAKVFGAAGDAGGIITSEPALRDACHSLANHGRTDHYRYEKVGWNSRLDVLQAVYLTHVLDYIDEMIDTRLAAAECYHRAFSAETQLLRYHQPPENVRGNGYLAVLTAKQHHGQVMVEALRKKGIGCTRTYPETIDAQEPARGALRASDLGRSRDFCERVFNLPLFAYITSEECERAAAMTLEVLSEL